MLQNTAKSISSCGKTNQNQTFIKAFLVLILNTYNLSKNRTLISPVFVKFNFN
jgi:hypothetical protein